MAQHGSQRTLQHLFASSDKTVHCSFADNQQRDYGFILYCRNVWHIDSCKNDLILAPYKYAAKCLVIKQHLWSKYYDDLMYPQKCNSCFLEMNDEAGILSHEKKC